VVLVGIMVLRFVGTTVFFTGVLVFFSVVVFVGTMVLRFVGTTVFNTGVLVFFSVAVLVGTMVLRFVGTRVFITVFDGAIVGTVILVGIAVGTIAVADDFGIGRLVYVRVYVKVTVRDRVIVGV